MKGIWLSRTLLAVMYRRRLRPRLLQPEEKGTYTGGRMERSSQLFIRFLPHPGSSAFGARGRRHLAARFVQTSPRARRFKGSKPGAEEVVTEARHYPPPSLLFDQVQITSLGSDGGRDVAAIVKLTGPV